MDKYELAKTIGEGEETQHFLDQLMPYFDAVEADLLKEFRDMSLEVSDFKMPEIKHTLVAMNKLKEKIREKINSGKIAKHLLEEVSK